MMLSILALFAVVTDATSTTITASTESQLREAAAKPGDVTILIDRAIEIRNLSMLSFGYGRAGATIRLIGVNDKAAIHFAAFTFDTWKEFDAKHGKALNGASFSAANVLIHNIRFSGYNWYGSCLKVDRVTDTFYVSGCTFTDIGNRIIPFRRFPSDAISDPPVSTRTMVIAAHRQPCHLIITGNTFRRCSNNVPRWSHCIYADPDQATIINNTFEQCGNPFELGRPARTPAGIHHVLSNVVTDPAIGPHPQRRENDRVAFATIRNPNDNTIYALNRLSGAFKAAYNGYFGRQVATGNLIFVGNDYSDATFGSFMIWTGRGYYSWNAWRHLAHDAHSLPPSSARQEPPSEDRVFPK